MKKTIILLSAGLSLVLLSYLSSCEDLFNLGDNPDELTTEEVIEGLKTALNVGTDTAVSVVSVTDGYYMDEIIKIPLPDEASIITDNLDNPLVQTLGLSSMIEDVILSINRSAEEAAKGAAPIFKDAITALSISDAWAILNGTNPANNLKSDNGEFDSTAATAYLKSTTYGSLEDLFSPVVNQALDQDIGLGFSANQAWNTLTGSYNSVAGTIAGQLAGLETVDTELDEFVVGKALDGLFYKVGLEEKKIRKDPLAWAGTAAGKIFEKVFGSD
jgi:hypothetical protein